MKHRINLIIKQKKYVYIERIFRNIRVAILLLAVVLLIMNVAFLMALRNQNDSIRALNEQKKEALEYLLTKKDVEAKFVFFNTKEKQISEILKNDVNFYPYYNLLVKSLDISSSAASLQTLTIDKYRKTKFSLKFNDYESFIAFFRVIEDDKLLQNFANLNLVSLNINGQNAGGYTMNFKGEFTQLK
ncbi:hypothetical protein HY214_03590 [Candidatus Roizmanbacteria bacterium]|nr:hypothetical protein [Candidatus Roizmanbacteria bacterium]